MLTGVRRGGDLANFRFASAYLGNIVGSHPNVVMRTQREFISPAMTIAKIGYCHAVAILGLEGFNGTDIRDLLNGRRDDVFDFVGSAERAEQNISKRYLHRLSIRSECGYIVSRVGLFSSLGFPHFEVVVGR